MEYAGRRARQGAGEGIKQASGAPRPVGGDRPRRSWCSGWGRGRECPAWERRGAPVGGRRDAVAGCGELIGDHLLLASIAAQFLEVREHSRLISEPTVRIRTVGDYL